MGEELGEGTMKSTQKHILIIRLSAMGDVAMTVPVIYAFAKANPNVKISFLSKPFFKPIIDTIPNVEFISAEVNTIHKGISGMWKLSRQLKKKGITHVADLHNVIRSKMLRAFLNLPSKAIDKGRTEKKELIKINGKVFKKLKTTVQRYAAVFEALGFDKVAPVTVPKMVLPERVLKLVGDKKHRWIGIAPYAAHKGKVYPTELMRQVIEQLDKTEGLTIILFGGLGEKEYLDQLSSKIQSSIVVAEQLLFSQDIRLISQLDVMLSMDSGNGHLAAMFGVPTVTLWGVTHPYAGFAPFRQEENCLVSDRKKYPLIPTSIYGNVIPAGYEDVMHSISPEDVVRKLEKLI